MKGKYIVLLSGIGSILTIIALSVSSSASMASFGQIKAPKCIR